MSFFMLFSPITTPPYLDLVSNSSKRPFRVGAEEDTITTVDLPGKGERANQKTQFLRFN